MKLSSRKLKRRMYAQHAPVTPRPSRMKAVRPAKTTPVVAKQAPARRRRMGPTFYITFGIFGIGYGLITGFSMIQYATQNTHGKPHPPVPAAYLILIAVYMIFGAANLFIGLRIRKQNQLADMSAASDVPTPQKRAARTPLTPPADQDIPMPSNPLRGLFKRKSDA